MAVRWCMQLAELNLNKISFVFQFAFIKAIYGVSDKGADKR